MEKFCIIFVSAVLVNNFVLTRFLGICPFLGVSRNLKQAFGMSLAVIFVMVMASTVTYTIYHKLLTPFGLEFLQTITFILVIASLVQLVEIVLIKCSKPLYESLGIYLPLITTNCAILGLAFLNILKEHTFFESAVFSAGAGAGFMLALILMAGIRERLDFSDVPKPFAGAAITLITAGILSLAFMGFSGLVKM
jgi:electron transport complex protein RnfA